MKLLILEDNINDAALIRVTLKRGGVQAEVKVVSTRKDFIEALDSFAPQFILSDHRLPGFSSTDALQISREKVPGIPFILVTGTASDEFAANIIKSGADDYILKDRLSRLPAAINGILRQRRIEKDKQLAINKLVENEEKYRTMVERISDAFVAFDTDWCFTFVNSKAAQLLRRQPAELIGKNAWDVFSDESNLPFYNAFHKALEEQKYVYLEEYYPPFDAWLQGHLYPSLNGLSIFFRDITKKKKAEKELQTTHERLSFHIENSPLAFIEWDSDLHVKKWSVQAEKIFGYTEAELISAAREGYSVEHIADLLHLSQIAGDLISGKVERQIVQYDNITKDGRQIYCEWYNSVLKNDEGKIVTILSLVQDITERKKAEEDLRKSEIRLNEAQAIAHISNWEIDLINNTHTWSDEVYNFCGLNREEVSPSAGLILSFIHPEDAAFAQQKFYESFGSHTNSFFNFRFIRKDGTIKHGYIEWKFEFDSEGKPLRIYGILQDVTAAREAEEALLSMKQEILDQKIQEQKRITRAVIKTQETERNYLGQELHDNINQILAGTKLYIALAANKSEELKKHLQYPMELLDRCIDEIRVLSSQMVTPKKNIDLEAMVQKLLANVNQTTPIKTAFTFSNEDGTLSDDLKLNTYRIIQEQINNVLKHARATEISISVKAQNDKIDVIVADNGRGFNVNEERNGIGILNMQNRVESYNGTMEIKSSPGNGCIIEVSIPL